MESRKRKTRRMKKAEEFVYNRKLNTVTKNSDLAKNRLSHFLFDYIYIYIYIYMCVCVCMCVSVCMCVTAQPYDVKLFVYVILMQVQN